MGTTSELTADCRNRKSQIANRKSVGVYQLHLQLDEPTRITVGRLGTFDFPAGCYIYTGSALGGLEARIARHRRSDKALHWHIDYFLQHAWIVDVTTVLASPPPPLAPPPHAGGIGGDRGGVRLECRLNAEVLSRPGARVIAPRCGASDCRCAAHLVFIQPLPPVTPATAAAPCGRPTRPSRSR